MSVSLSALNNSAPTGRIFMKFGVWNFSITYLKSQVSLKSNKNNGYFTWRPAYIYDTIPLNSSKNEIMSQTKVWRENQNTHSMLKNFFFSKNHAVYEITWKNIVEPGRPHMTIWRMRIACWIPKATNTHWEYVILIAFPQQRWLYEGPSMLGYTCIAWLVVIRSFVSVTKHSPRTMPRTNFEPKAC